MSTYAIYRNKQLPVIVTMVVLATILMFTACNSGSNSDKNNGDSLSETQLHLPENALKTLEIADGLEVEKMATEPAIKNPTNIDVDDRGRIWVTEAYNYRPAINGNPSNPAGDRIMILEDSNNDGSIDTAKVFYQGPEVNAPLGVAVLGDRVFISQSPYVWVFYDDNHDDKADRKEILFQGIGGEQHDHGMHTFVAGPDGKLYFNFGNEGHTLKDKNNKTVLDQDGDEIGPKKYKQGMVFRCDFDGSHVECLGNNFRNPFELAVDSYGTIWQSDNDDDGNRGVRVNYVMEYGNYGYTDEMTGASWQSTRVNMEDSIPIQHWHLNDPGTMPNMLQTGSGSPTGMVVYEGTLLPAIFQKQLIHCEPGHNVVRSYELAKDGAGYKATINNILNDDKDKWFRPSDVCVAPDGSLIVADWYDPGVGGHAAGDQQKGRIYRIAPKGSVYKTAAVNYTTPDGAVAALQSPNIATRYKAFVALQKMGTSAVAPLENVWKTASDNRMRARAFWALVKMPGGDKYIAQAIADKDADLRITGLRSARELNANIIGIVGQLINDNDMQVRRECLLALHHNKSPEAAALWVTLAGYYDAKDRWYLEALGIGAADQWEAFFDAYVQKVGDPLQTAAGRDIVWRARTNKTLPLLAKLASDSAVPLKQRLRYFRAFDFNTSAAKTNTLFTMMSANKSNNVELNEVLLRLLTPAQVKQSAVATNTLKTTLQATYGQPAYIDLLGLFKDKEESDRLWQMILHKTDDDIAVEGVKLYIDMGNENALRSFLQGNDTVASVSVVPALGKAGYDQTINILQTVITGTEYAQTLRLAAAENIGKSWNGEDRVVRLLQTKKMPAALVTNAVESLRGGLRNDMYEAAKTYLPGAGNKVSETKDITLADLTTLKANKANGEKVFVANCTVCHQVKNEGKDFGPKLTEIGSKLPKEALLAAIKYPSEGIGSGYETWQIVMKDGSKLKGIVSSKTENEIDLKLPGGTVQKIRISGVASTQQLKESMMPVLYESMTKQQLADLLEYLSSLTKK